MQLSALVGNTYNVMRIQHIVFGRQEVVMMWAKEALVKIRGKKESGIRRW